MTEDELKPKLELHGKWLRGEPGGVRLDLSGKDLRGARFVRTDLSFARMDGAILTRANMTQAKLVGVNFVDAILTDAILTDSDLSDASLMRAHLGYAVMARTNLTGADLTGATGNKREVMAMQIENYLTTWWWNGSSQRLAIGHKSYPIDLWKGFTTDDCAEMAGEKMFNWMMKWRKTAIEIVEMSPAVRWDATEGEPK